MYTFIIEFILISILVVCVNIREIKENTILSKKNAEMGEVAVSVATKGESQEARRPKIRCDWSEFGKFVGIWLLTATILFGALIIITVVKGSTNVIKDTIKEVDTINMTFSLVLSALLEQIWSKNGNKGKLYNFTLGVEGFLTIIGGMLYVAYSIVKTTAPDNELLKKAYEFNIAYIIVSIIVVILGFFSRALSEKK